MFSNTFVSFVRIIKIAIARLAKNILRVSLAFLLHTKTEITTEIKYCDSLKYKYYQKFFFFKNNYFLNLEKMLQIFLDSA